MKKNGSNRNNQSEINTQLHIQNITIENKIKKLEVNLQIEKTKADEIEATINNTDNEKKLETLENKLKTTKNKIKNLKFNQKQKSIQNKPTKNSNQNINTTHSRPPQSGFSTDSKSTNFATHQTEQIVSKMSYKMPCFEL